MRVRLTQRVIGSRTGLYDLTARQHPYPAQVDQFLLGLSEHDLRDIEFALAQRRAMARRCTAEHGEHTCSLAPGHIADAGHLCRGCDVTWPVREQEGSDGTQ